MFCVYNGRAFDEESHNSLVLVSDQDKCQILLHIWWRGKCFRCMSKDAGERSKFTEIKKGQSQNWLELWTEQKQNPHLLVKTNPIHFEEKYKTNTKTFK